MACHMKADGNVPPGRPWLWEDFATAEVRKAHRELERLYVAAPGNVEEVMAAEPCKISGGQPFCSLK